MRSQIDSELQTTKKKSQGGVRAPQTLTRDKARGRAGGISDSRRRSHGNPAQAHSAPISARDLPSPPCAASLECPSFIPGRVME